MQKHVTFKYTNDENGHERPNMVSLFIIFTHFGVMMLHAFGLSYMILCDSECSIYCVFLKPIILDP